MCLGKEEIRTRVKQKRAIFDRKEYAVHDIKIQQNALLVLQKILYARKQEAKAQENIDKTEIIGLYYPMAGEPNLIGLLDNNFSDGNYLFCLPKITSEMFFVKYEKQDELESNKKFKTIKEPREIKEVAPEIIMVPAFSYDERGARIGFGAGHYDRYFVKNKSRKIIKIGACYHENLHKELQQEEHDIKMDYIITEKTTIKI